MCHDTGVSTSDVVTQGIVDEGILVLLKFCHTKQLLYKIYIVNVVYVVQDIKV